MAQPALHRSFIALHLTLGLVIAVESARTLMHALSSHGYGHLSALATLEIIAALLFLWPRTTRIGGVTLVGVFVVALLHHATHAEFPASVLVYAVAVLFVTVHGSAWRSLPAGG